jgi:O-acetyl-ADP-ribose deacetylase (regulator of RNase III)
MKETRINDRVVRLVVGDITDMEVEAFVFYASHDLKLGTGFGSAIAMRGGQSIQKALDEMGGAETCQSVITEAGEMKAKHIIHSVGPRHNEPDIEGKLKRTIDGVIKLAEDNGIKQVAFPPMGAGFYGVPLPTCSKIMLETFAEYLKNEPKLDEIIISALDSREYKPFEAAWSALS